MIKYIHIFIFLNNWIIFWKINALDKLIFIKFIKNSEATFEENTEELLKGFIKDILKIEEGVPLQVAHRSRMRRDGHPRSIFANFVHMKDSDRVLDT